MVHLQNSSLSYIHKDSATKKKKGTEVVMHSKLPAFQREESYAFLSPLWGVSPCRNTWLAGAASVDYGEHSSLRPNPAPQHLSQGEGQKEAAENLLKSEHNEISMFIQRYIFC